MWSILLPPPHPEKLRTLVIGITARRPHTTAEIHIPGERVLYLHLSKKSCGEVHACQWF